MAAIVFDASGKTIFNLVAVVYQLAALIPPFEAKAQNYYPRQFSRWPPSGKQNSFWPPGFSPIWAPQPLFVPTPPPRTRGTLFPPNPSTSSDMPRRALFTTHPTTKMAAAPKAPATTKAPARAAKGTSDTKCIGKRCITVHLKESTWQRAHDSCIAEKKSMSRLTDQKAINVTLQLIHELNHKKYDAVYIWQPIKCEAFPGNKMMGHCWEADSPSKEFSTNPPASEESRLWQTGEPDYGFQSEQPEPCVAFLYGKTLQQQGRIADSNGRIGDYACEPDPLEGKDPSYIFAWACEVGGEGDTVDEPQTPEPDTTTATAPTTESLPQTTTQVKSGPPKLGRAWEGGKICFKFDPSLTQYEKDLWAKSRRQFLASIYGDRPPTGPKCISLDPCKADPKNYVLVSKPAQVSSEPVCNSVSLGMEGGGQRFELAAANGQMCNVLNGMLRLAGVDAQQSSAVEKMLSGQQSAELKKLYNCGK